MKPVLFCVDDDAAVLAAVVRDMVDRYGSRWQVHSAPGAEAAMAVLQRLKLEGVPVALLLVDQRMPGRTGLSLLQEAARLYPRARRVLLTAWADSDAAVAAINDVGIDHYLLKPWDPPEERLYPVLDDLLESWQAQVAALDSGLRIVSSRWSADGHHLRDFLTRNLVPYRWLDLETDDEAAALLHAAGGDAAALPLVVLQDGTALHAPSAAELGARIGFNTNTSDDAYDVVIVGAGPAGLAAAVHTASDGLRTLLVERQAPGGQAALSARIENYLGFPVGLSGAELARRALAQAKRFGTELVSPVEATALRIQGGHPVVQLSDGSSVSTQALLIASGVQYRRLDVPGADRLVGAGVYYGGAITEAVRVAGRDVHLLGGGNSAAQAALHLCRFARSVTLLVRNNDLSSSMSRYLRDRLADTRNVHVRTGTEVTGVIGDDRLQSISVRDRATGTVESLSSFGLFVFIGASAHTDWLGGLVRRDAQGFVYTGPDVMHDGARPDGWTAARDPFLLESNVPGVFVAGDVRHRIARGVAAAVGEGNMAAQFICQHVKGASIFSGQRKKEAVLA